MERTRFIEHRGKRILLLEYVGIHDPQEALAAIRNSMKVVAAEPAKSLVILTDVTNARYNAEVLQAMKEMAARNEPHVKISAIVGVTGLLRIAYQAVILFSRRNIRVFLSRPEALDWLVDNS